MSPEDARARLAAQAGDEERRAAADVLLPNPRRAAGAPDPLPGLVEALWRERLLPFEANLRAGRPAPARPVAPVDPDPGWAAAGRADLRAGAPGWRGSGPWTCSTPAPPRSPGWWRRT